VNWDGLSRAFAAILQIGNGFAQARADGEVSPAEICGISAAVGKVWVDAEHKSSAVTGQQLIDAFRRAGWDVYTEE
jgi:hypothetical protein